MAAPTHFADAHLTVYVGDCREVMAVMPAESVHCVVTSPPYWGLRDYGRRRRGREGTRRATTRNGWLGATRADPQRWFPVARAARGAGLVIRRRIREVPDMTDDRGLAALAGVLCDCRKPPGDPTPCVYHQREATEAIGERAVFLPDGLATLAGHRACEENMDAEIAHLRAALDLADAVVDAAAEWRHMPKHEYLTVLVNRSLDERAARAAPAAAKEADHA